MRYFYHSISGNYFSQKIEENSTPIPLPNFNELSLEDPQAPQRQQQLPIITPPGATVSVEQVPPRFGLIHDGPNRWPTLFDHIDKMNELSTAEEAIKLIFLVRHGEGYHNVAEAKYGSQAWDDYWSKLDGDGEITWGPDPLLTPTGVSQAQFAQSLWTSEVEHGGLTPPLKIYCSPLTRALKTCEIVFKDHSDLVTVIENAREENGEHTCDKRRTRSYIEETFPDFTIEESLTEQDELWDPVVRETKAQVGARANGVLDRIWEEHPNDNFVAITAHSGFINGILLTLRAKPYPLPPGGVLPLIIQRILLSDKFPTDTGSLRSLALLALFQPVEVGSEEAEPLGSRGASGSASKSDQEMEE